MPLDQIARSAHVFCMRPIHENDIRWLLDGSAAAALGMRSAHASFVARLEGSSGSAATDESDIQDRLCEAAGRERRIREVFERCSHAAQHVLRAWARQDKIAPYWGTLTHVLPLCPQFDAAKHAGTKGHSMELRLTLGNADEAQKVAALRLRRWAETAVASALAEYGAIFDAAAEKGRAA